MLKQISGKQFNIQYIDGPTGVKTRYCSIENAKNKIQWEPTTTLEESTRITYKFVLDQLKLTQKPVIKKNIGFITQPNGFAGEIKSAYCGIGIRGKLTSDILLKQTSDKYNFIVGFMNSNEELENFIAINQPEVLIYNYHSITTPFLNDPTLRYKYNNIKHVMIHYDIIQHMVNIFNPTNFLGFKYIITDNEKINNESAKNNVFKVTRSVPFIDEEILLNHAYQKDDIPKIGFQGFCSGCKLIENIAMKIQEEFDVAIFRIHSPPIFYGSEETTLQILENVKRIITKPGIKIEISREFLSDEEIIKWLHENTINCYFYFYGENAGIASSPDYAIAAKKPIVVNNSLMLMNLHGLTPSIEIEKSTIKQIIANGIEPLKPLYEKYDNKNVLRDYETICDYLLDT
jgi:hypothetical protein